MEKEAIYGYVQNCLISVRLLKLFAGSLIPKVFQNSHTVFGAKVVQKVPQSIRGVLGHVHECVWTCLDVFWCA